MTTITISHADWELLEDVLPSAVSVTGVTASEIAVSVALGAGRTAHFLITGSFSGISGLDLTTLSGTVTGISMDIDSVLQFEATDLSIDVSEVTDDLFIKIHDVVELALGEGGTVIGSDDDDGISGSIGDDSISGGDGDDDLYGDLGDDSLVGGSGKDNISGGSGHDDLDGDDGDDTLNGGTGDDSLDGGSGNDKLYGNAGVDTLNGGIGDDAYIVKSSDDVIVELSGGGKDTKYAFINASLEDEVENLILMGTTGLSGNGNGLNNVISGSAGSNSLGGEAGDDSIKGGAGDDSVDGDDGNDSLSGGLGDDSLSGGSGNDKLISDGGMDTLVGGSGDDAYFIRDSDDTIVEDASGGKDTVYATISYDLDDEVENLVLGGSSGNSGSGNGLDNVVSGNSGDNSLSGLSGKDTLKGGLGDDSLVGDGDDDWLVGGVGDDSISGGSGADKFDYNLVTESNLLQMDSIEDFSALEGDKIDLSTIDANVGLTGNQAFGVVVSSNAAFDAASTFSAAGQLYFDQTSQKLYANVDADAEAEFVVHLVGVSSLTASEIIE